MNLSNVMQMMQRPPSGDDLLDSNDVSDGFSKNNSGSFGSYNENVMYDINSLRFVSPYGRDPQMASSSENLPTPSNLSLEVVLFHKPKGSKGLWKRVEAGDKLRVTKGNGKRLKLQVTSAYDFDKESLSIKLLDLDLRTSFSPDKDTGSFVVELAKCHERTIEISLKIFRMGGRLQFSTSIVSKEYGLLQGTCSEFISYSSGSVREKPQGKVSASQLLSSSAPSGPSTSASQLMHQFNAQNSTGLSSSAVLHQLGHNNGFQLPLTSAYGPSSSGLHNQMYTGQHSQPAFNPRSSLPSSSPPGLLPQISPQGMPQNTMSQNMMPRSKFLPHQLQSTVAAPQPQFSGMGSNLSMNYGLNEIKSEPNANPGEVTTQIPGNLDVKGVVRAKAYMQFSDMRLKTNIVDLVDAVQIVTALQGKRYEWKEDPQPLASGPRKVIGLIAQEVQRVLPEVVREDADTGLLSVSYTEILPVLIEAFKEFIHTYQSDKEQLQSEVFILQTKLHSMNQELEKANLNHHEVQLMVENSAHRIGEATPRTKTVDPDATKTKGLLRRRSRRHLGVQPCRVIQLVFILFLAIFVICAIIGVVIGTSNSNTGDFTKPNDQDQNAPPSDVYQEYSSNSAAMEDHRVTGLSIFESGAIGVGVCGIGAICSTVFIYLMSPRKCPACKHSEKTTFSRKIKKLFNRKTRREVELSNFGDDSTIA